MIENNELKKDLAAVLNKHSVDNKLCIADYALAEDLINYLFMKNRPTISVNKDGNDEYTIESLVQLYRIPEDKFDNFLLDLKLGVNTMRPVVELTEMMCEITGANPDRAINLSKFHWIDDGKHGDNADLSNCNIHINSLPVAGSKENEETNENN